LAGIGVRTPRRAAGIAAAIVAAAALAPVANYWTGFGNPLGAVALMKDTNSSVHSTSGWISFGVTGFAGLLLSPSRGLLVFSPIVAVAIAGFADALRAPWTSPLRWCAAAALAQFMVYGVYSVWWAGHTYGPRYLLDVLPLLVPLAAAAMTRARFGAARAAVAAAALAWSIAPAATGAFCYPHEQWNSDPVD